MLSDYVKSLNLRMCIEKLNELVDSLDNKLIVDFKSIKDKIKFTIKENPSTKEVMFIGKIELEGCSIVSKNFVEEHKNDPEFIEMLKTTIGLQIVNELENKK